MKKMFVSLILLTLLVASACQIAREVDFKDDNQIKSQDFIKSNLARELNPSINHDQLQTLAEDNRAFAFSFYQLAREEDENIIFSPLSLSLALSMALEGAESTTEQAMLNGLNLSLPKQRIHPGFNALLRSIEDSGKAVEDDMTGNPFMLNIANSIWGQSDYEFNQDFLNTLALNYGAGIHTVDFKTHPEPAREAINHWVEEETNNKIRDLIPSGAIDPLTRLVLANAIYFNGSWLHPFNKNLTGQAPFTTLDDSLITVDMMSLPGERFLYKQGDGYQAINLPYLSTDFAMTVLIPDQGAFQIFEQSLTTEKLQSIFNTMSFERVDLQMPSFDYETTINANEILSALGMDEAFDPERADFSGITAEEDLMITDVLHKATITVDEGGTEAAAATAVIIGVTSAMPEDPINLVIDRPFLFLIQHRPTGTILFMGRVISP